MSTLTGNDVMGLMEAYQAVYAPQELTEEQVWEEVETWVNDLIEEGYDLSDYTWEEMFEAYIEEIYGTNLGGNTKTKPNKLDTAVGNAVKSITSSGADATPRTTGIYGQPTRKPAAPPDGKVGPKIVGPKIVGPGASQPPAKPTTAAPPKPAAPRPSGTTPAAKPAPKPAGSAMDQWAKANPKLAADAAERARTRGTSSTTNPLMADMKSRLPAAAPKVAPSNTLSNTVAAASKPAAFNPTPVASSKLKKEEYDAYDLVLEYLLSQGHADTLEEANYVMLELDAEMIGDIVEVMTPPPIMSPPPVKAPPTPPKVKKDITFGPGETPKGPVGKGGKPMDY